MAKEKHTDPEKEARKLAKAEQKAKRAETDGVHKSKSDKKEKKEKGAAIEVPTADAEVTTQLLNVIEAHRPGSVAAKLKNGVSEIKMKTEPLQGALVPFASPLADEKVTKKVLKSVKKAAKYKTLKRGVKEVVKALRKSSMASVSGVEAPGIVILAADISPMDVISHLPVLCEDHGVPYMFITSRAELGAAGNTKRPTSVVMISKEATGKKKSDATEDKEGEDDFAEVYKDLHKTVVKASRNVRI